MKDIITTAAMVLFVIVLISSLVFGGKGTLQGSTQDVVTKANSKIATFTEGL